MSGRIISTSLGEGAEISRNWSTPHCLTFMISSELSWSLCGGLVAKSCLTLSTPRTVAHQTPLSMGFSRQE